MTDDRCLACDCTFETGCKLEPPPTPEQHEIKAPRIGKRRGPYKLAKKRTLERECVRLLKRESHV